MSVSKETELGSNNQEEASLSAGQNIRLVLVSYCAWKFKYSQGLWSYLLQQMTSQWGSQKIDPYLMNSQPHFLIFISFLTQ